MKEARFQVLYRLFREEATVLNKQFVGTEQVVLIEGVSGGQRIVATPCLLLFSFSLFLQDSKRSSDWHQGRTDGNIRVNFPKVASVSKGDFCLVRIVDSTSQSLRGEALARTDLQGKTLEKLSGHTDTDSVDASLL